MAPMTTFGIGGPARYFVRAANEEHLEHAFSFAAERGAEIFVLGGGSNLLVADAGFNGLVVRIEMAGWELAKDEETLHVGAGESWDSVVATAVGKCLAGIECMSGIPGSAGGTPVQNVGAYGQEVAETIVSVRCFDRIKGEMTELSNSECGFAYRTSIFNSSERGRYVVTRVSFRLKKDGLPNLTYRDLAAAADGRQFSLTEAREAVIAIRRAKSMVVDAGDRNSHGAGSFFKNPIIAAEEAAAIAGAPTFPAGSGLVKVPAAWLIEKAGFEKGFQMGRAGISQKHSLALVNLGGARAADVLALKDAIQAGVHDKFGIELKPEPVFLGF